MAPIKSQIVDSDDGVFVEGTDGRTVVLSPGDVLAYFAAHGSAETLAWAKGRIQAGLGADQISADEMVLVLDGMGNIVSFGTKAV